MHTSLMEPPKTPKLSYADLRRRQDAGEILEPEWLAQLMLDTQSGYNALGAYTATPVDVPAIEAARQHLLGVHYTPTLDLQKGLAAAEGCYRNIRTGRPPKPTPEPPKKSIHHVPFPAYDPLEEEEETDDAQDYITPLPDLDEAVDGDDGPVPLTRNLQKIPKLTEGRYVTAPFEVIFDHNLRAGDIICYLAIASHAKPGQPIPMSTSRIVQLTGHSPRFVREATNRLRQFGHLRASLVPFGSSSGRITQYTLTSPVFALRAHKKGN